MVHGSHSGNGKDMQGKLKIKSHRVEYKLHERTGHTTETVNMKENSKDVREAENKGKCRLSFQRELFRSLAGEKKIEDLGILGI